MQGNRNYDCALCERNAMGVNFLLAYLLTYLLIYLLTPW